MNNMLVAFDLDGTLHCRDAEDEGGALAELADCLRDRGAFTVLATGRSLEETLELDQIMNCLPVDAIVANSGAQVYFGQSVGFMQDASFAARPGAEMPDSDRFALIALFLGNASVTLQEERHQFPGKLAFYVRTEALAQLRALVNEAKTYYPAYEYLVSYNPPDRGFHYFDVHPRQSTKLAGLWYVADVFGVVEENIIYFGDNGNDLPCIRGLRRAAIIDTYLDELRKDADGFDWHGVMQLRRGGAATMVQALREMGW
ncbi:hypothetical protein GCM10027046_27630 [Uliginosibacterium flavum]|uniref:HAD-IIB family hydrolase n=1 Tax=Uliginosibacterium flavum TaxID=1396831 RepID=A0ABV2TJM6_9RHOO